MIIILKEEHRHQLICLRVPASREVHETNYKHTTNRRLLVLKEKKLRPIIVYHLCESHVLL